MEGAGVGIGVKVVVSATVDDASAGVSEGVDVVTGNDGVEVGEGGDVVMGAEVVVGAPVDGVGDGVGEGVKVVTGVAVDGEALPYAKLWRL